MMIYKDYKKYNTKRQGRSNSRKYLILGIPNVIPLFQHSVHSQHHVSLPAIQLHIGGLNLSTDTFTHYIIWSETDIKWQTCVKNITHI